jgi:hypothetical protein
MRNTVVVSNLSGHHLREQSSSFICEEHRDGAS